MLSASALVTGNYYTRCFWQVKYYFLFNYLWVGPKVWGAASFVHCRQRGEKKIDIVAKKQ